MKLRIEWLSSCVSVWQGLAANCRKSWSRFFVSMLMRRRKSGETTITSALKYSSDLTWRIFFGLKMKIEFFFSRYSCRLSDTLVSPSVPTPMTKASMRHGNRKISIRLSLLAVKHSLIRPWRLSPDISMSCDSVNELIIVSVWFLFISSFIIGRNIAIKW